MTWRPGDPLVYVIEAVGLNVVKIGSTNDLAKRLSMLQVGCPALLRVVLTLDGDKMLECDLHQRFAKICVRGEWFLFTEEIRRLHDDHPRATGHPGNRFGVLLP